MENKNQAMMYVNNDGKGKYQSFTISVDSEFIQSKFSSDYKKYNGLYDLDVTSINGYGETRDEALDDFISKFDAMFEEIQTLHNNLHNHRDSVYFTEVDYAGNQINN